MLIYEKVLRDHVSLLSVLSALMQAAHLFLDFVLVGNFMFL